MLVPLIDPVTLADQAWVRALMCEQWGGPEVVSRGRVHLPEMLPGFIARIEGEPVGLITYRIEDGEVEITTLNSLRRGVGAGTRLLEAVIAVARGASRRRIWLITTNDNLPALGFYQRRGFELVAVHRDALEVSRRLKPSIPRIGHDRIPLRDEIELEMRLEG